MGYICCHGLRTTRTIYTILKGVMVCNFIPPLIRFLVDRWWDERDRNLEIRVRLGFC